MFDCFTSDASRNPQLKSILEVPQMQQNVQPYRSRRVPQMQQNVRPYQSRRVPQPDLYQTVCQRKKKSKGTFHLKSKSEQSEACGSQKSEVSLCEIAEVDADVGNVGGEIKSCGIQKKILPEVYRSNDTKGGRIKEAKSVIKHRLELNISSCVDVAYGERHPLQARDIMPTSTSNGTVEQVMTVLRSVDKPMVHVDVEHEISNTQTRLGNGKRRRKATTPYNPYQCKLMRDAARSDDNNRVGSNDCLRDCDTVDNNSNVESSVEYVAVNVDRSTVFCLSSGAKEANYKWGSSCSMNDRGVITSVGEETYQSGKGERGKENLSDKEQDSKRKRSGVSNISIGNAGKNDKDLPSCSSPPRDENLRVDLTGNSSEMPNKDLTANEIGQHIVKDNDKVKEVNGSNVKNEDTVCCALIGGSKQGQVAVEANTKPLDTSIDDIVIVSDTTGDFGKLIEAHGDTEGQVAEEVNTKLVNTSIHDTVIGNDTEDVGGLVSAIDPKLEAKINRLKRIVSAVKAAKFRSRRMW